MNKVVEFINNNLVWFIVILAVITAVLLFFLIRAIISLKKGKANPQIAKPEGMTTQPAPEKEKKVKEKKEKGKKNEDSNDSDDGIKRPTLTIVDTGEDFTTEYGDGTIIDGNAAAVTKQEEPVARPFVKPEPEPYNPEPYQPEEDTTPAKPVEQPAPAVASVRKFKIAKLTTGEARFKFEENDVALFISEKYPDVETAKSELTSFKEIIKGSDITTVESAIGFRYQFDFEGTVFATSVSGFASEEEAQEEGLRVQGLLS